MIIRDDEMEKEKTPFKTAHHQLITIRQLNLLKTTL